MLVFDFGISTRPHCQVTLTDVKSHNGYVRNSYRVKNKKQLNIALFHFIKSLSHTANTRYVGILLARSYIAPIRGGDVSMSETPMGTDTTQIHCILGVSRKIERKKEKIGYTLETFWVRSRYDPSSKQTFDNV